MEFSERKRLMWYSILLLLVVGGMIYLNEEWREVGNNEAAAQANTAGANQSLAGDEKTTGDKPFTPKPYPYEQREASWDGTGKIYMGREISKVMGHAAIDWLERPERDAEEATTQVIKGLERELSKDAVVVDVGSGSGYYSFRLAKLVPQGKVIGVDIQPEMVAYLVQKAQQMGVSNVESRLGKVDHVQLPAACADAVVMVDAYHEFSHPNEMMQSVIHGLKPKGRVYLLEYRAEDPAVPIKPLHKMSEAQVIKEMQVVGLRHVKTEGFLPWQHFLVFEKY